MRSRVAIADIGLDLYLPTGVRRVPTSLTYADVGLDLYLPTGVRTFKPPLSINSLEITHSKPLILILLTYDVGTIVGYCKLARFYMPNNRS